MVSFKEIYIRLKEHLRFSNQELFGIGVAVLAAAFIFSFRDWGGEVFNLLAGLRNFALVILIAGISFFFRQICQKVYALSNGHQAEFKVWWNGITASLIIAFISFGRLPLVLSGGMVSSFVVKLRLGEFRYGFSNWVMGITALWGVLGNLILAILFGVGAYLSPQSYFFSKGMVFNLVMAICSLIPLPQQDGLSIFFGRRFLYYVAIGCTLLTAVLLLTKTALGLIILIVLGSIWGIVALLITSEKD